MTDQSLGHIADAYDFGLMLLACLVTTVAALLKFPGMAALRRATNSVRALKIAEQAHMYFLLAVACVLFIAVPQMSHSHYRASLKVEAHANILSAEQSRCSNGMVFAVIGISEPRCVSIQYQFNAGAESYDGWAGYADEEANYFQEFRDVYKVCYDPNDPRRSELQKPMHKCGT